MSVLSVIIPLYNCENFVAQCLDSVLCQNNIDLEVLVIDDGSSDGSLNIVKNYQQVKIFEIEHGGASVARNYGLRQSRGEYVMFIDADDFLDDKDICSRCISKMRAEGTKLCLFSYKYFFDGTNQFRDARTLQLSTWSGSSTVQLLSVMISGGYFPASPCFRVIKRDYLLDYELYFEEGVVSEDVDWFVKSMLFLDRFSVDDSTCYCYRKGLSNSVTGSSSLSKCNDFVKALIRSVNHVEKSQNDIVSSLLYSGLAYEYSILLSNSYHYLKSKYIKDCIKSLSWLLDYQLFPNVKKVSFLYKLFGLRLSSLVLNLYSRIRSRSQS